jgi:hypothetical protein
VFKTGRQISQPSGVLGQQASELVFLKWRLSTRAVQLFMTGGAYGNQIQIVIRALLTAQRLVMDLQILSGATESAIAICRCALAITRRCNSDESLQACMFPSGEIAWSRFSSY